MARRTPFYAHLTNIVSKNRSCPPGSSMVAGKCVTETPTPATSKPVSVGLLSRTQTPAKSIEYPTKISVGSSTKRTTAVTEEKPLTNISEKKSITLGSDRPTQTIYAMGRSISSDQISTIKEKISAMSLPETSPGNVPERSTPNSGKPNKLIQVTKEKPMTLSGGVSATTEEPGVSKQPVLYIKNTPIKM